jgi:hypothetical protein
MLSTFAALIVLLAGVAGAAWAEAAGEEWQLDPVLEGDLKSSIDVGLKFLRFEQEEDGSWSGDPRTTALILRALMESHRKYKEEDGPFIRRALEYLAEAAEADQIRSVEGKAAVAMALGLSTTPRYREIGAGLARELIDAQEFDGYWRSVGSEPGEEDRFATTAIALLALEQLYGE